MELWYMKKGYLDSGLPEWIWLHNSHSSWRELSFKWRHAFSKDCSCREKNGQKLSSAHFGCIGPNMRRGKLLNSSKTKERVNITVIFTFSVPGFTLRKVAASWVCALFLSLGVGYKVNINNATSFSLKMFKVYVQAKYLYF